MPIRVDCTIFPGGKKGGELGRDMNLTQMKNVRLVAYENVRQQAAIDMRNGGKYRVVGDGVKEYADKLRLEIDRRRLQVRPIDWPA
jgi:hypothetical protein